MSEGISHHKSRAVYFFIAVLLAACLLPISKSMASDKSNQAMFEEVDTVNSAYVQEEQPYSFAVIGNASATPAVNNLCWMLGNLSVSYKTVFPSEVTDDQVLDNVDGVVSLVDNTETLPNVTVIRNFARDHVVISDSYDFCNLYFPSLSRYLVTATGVAQVTYLIDWGSFRRGDRPEFRRSDSSLQLVLNSGIAMFSNITKIAQYDSTRIAFFRMAGDTVSSGYYVLDLNATRDSSLTANDWHLFPVISYVQKIEIGKYARWMANGLNWNSLDWVNGFMQNLALKYPTLVQVHSIGTTVEGRSINALFIGTGNRYFLVDAGIHGDEKTGTVACLRLAELLTEFWDSNNSYYRTLLSDYQVIIVPVSNPDAYSDNVRTNANGVDLNRNYPPDGPTQLTEPESKAFANLLANYPPTVYINLHCGGFQSLYYCDASSPLQDPFRRFALETWNLANISFISLGHWGLDEGRPLYKINHIGKSYLAGPAYEYAWWKYNATSLLVEFFNWSPAYNLLGQEYFLSIIFTAIEHYGRSGDVLTYSTTRIETTRASGGAYSASLSTDGYEQTYTEIYTGPGGKPKIVYLDGARKIEGDEWSWDNNANIITVENATKSIYLSWDLATPWDLNQDGKVDGKDVAIVSLAFGSVQGSSNWNPLADLNADGKIDGADIAIDASHFGE
jgi:hypothetical protein